MSINFTHRHGAYLITVMTITDDFIDHPNKIVALVVDEELNIHSRHYFNHGDEPHYIISEVIDNIEDHIIPDEQITYCFETGLNVLTTTQKLPSIRVTRYVNPVEPVTFEFNCRMKCETGKIIYKYIEVPLLNVLDNVVYEGIEYTVRFIQRRNNRDGVDSFKYYCSDIDMNLRIINGGSCVQAVCRGKSTKERLNKQVSIRIPLYLWEIIRDGVDANTTTNSIINDSLHSVIGQFFKENPVR